MGYVSQYKNIPILECTEGISYKNECVIECYEALDDGSRNMFFINEATGYLKDIIYDTLETIKKALLDIWQKLFEYVSSYIINSVTVLKKIKNKLLLVDDKKIESIMYRTYEYPELNKLPIEIKQNLSDYDKQVHFTELTDYKNKFDKHSYSDYVDDRIDKFASLVMGQKMKIRNDLHDSISNMAYKKMRGSEKIVHLNRDNFEKMIDDLINYKDLKSEIAESKDGILSYYDKIKSSADSVYKTKEDANSIKSMYDPNLAKLSDQQQENLTFASIETNRMYNSFINIYQTAFKAKLMIINDMITLNKKVISDILKTVYLPDGLRLTKSEYSDSSVKLIY